MNVLIWVPIVFIIYCILGYCSIKNNIPNSNIIWLYLVWIIGMIPGWAVVSRYSTNIVRDAFLYNISMYFAEMLIIILLSSIKLSYYQYGGIILIIFGFILFEIGKK